jgi:broad specificity phosphatase PhoE
MIKPTRVILVRHGETEANLLQIWHGSLDAPLTERGRLQVEATAQRFAECVERNPIDRLYVSPLPRAQSTAAAIGAAINLKPVIEEGLREFSIGDWEGRTYRDLMDNEQLWRRWDIDPHFAPPNGESPNSFGERVEAACSALVERHAQQTIVAVTHGGVISAVLDAWLGNHARDWMRWDPHNCAVSVLEWDGDGWHAIVVNDVGHLPAAALAAEPPAYLEEFEQADLSD